MTGIKLALIAGICGIATFPGLLAQAPGVEYGVPQLGAIAMLGFLLAWTIMYGQPKDRKLDRMHMERVISSVAEGFKDTQKGSAQLVQQTIEANMESTKLLASSLHAVASAMSSCSSFRREEPDLTHRG